MSRVMFLTNTETVIFFMFSFKNSWTNAFQIKVCCLSDIDDNLSFVTSKNVFEIFQHFVATFYILIRNISIFQMKR